MGPLSVQAPQQIPMVSIREVRFSPNFIEINLQTDIGIATRQQRQQALADRNAPPPPRPAANAGAHYYAGPPITLVAHIVPLQSEPIDEALGTTINTQA
jgi:hypothetical protein